MSSICAVWTPGRPQEAGRLLGAMQNAQTIYGPDCSFRWAGDEIALGGNLLHLLPEDSQDRQPLWDRERQSCLVADVRLDNRPDLERELAIVQPEQKADSEILLEAWARWGADCLDHLIGSFAFAVWTPAKLELFAARDHVGDRPLFFHRGSDFVAVASMPKGLLAIPGVRRGFSEEQVGRWLVGMQPRQAENLFEGIERVPMGHFVRVTPHGLECRRYWHPSNAKPVRYKRDEEYAEAMVEILDQATEARLRSSKAIGSHLSAGLDSSSVTAGAARLLAMKGKSLTAFTAVPRPGYNGVALPWQRPFEGDTAAELAQLYPNIEHVRVDSSGYGLMDTVRDWTAAMDEPVVNATNLLWISAIQDRARERGLGVLLEGSCGNGTISWESWAIMSMLFRSRQWLKLVETVRAFRRRGHMSYRAGLTSSLNGLLPTALVEKLSPAAAFDLMESTMVSEEAVQSFGLEAKMAAYLSHAPVDPLQQQADLLDQFDMGATHAAVRARAGLDARDPTSDKRLFDFCFAIPQEQYVVDGHTRSLVRRAMRGRVPSSILNRYRRGLQSADWYLAMQEAMPDLRAELKLNRGSKAACGFLNLSRMETLLDDFPQAEYETKRVNAIWHTGLSRGFTMGYFLRSYESGGAKAGKSAGAVGESDSLPSSSV